MTWICSNCKSEVDDDLGLCWQCGTGANGEPAPSGWRSEAADLPNGSVKELGCLRCSSPMAHVGRKKFHEGSYSRELLLGDFFVNREAYDVYACARCGKVEFFLA